MRYRDYSIRKSMGGIFWAALGLWFAAAASAAPVPVATYDFSGNSLAAAEASVAPLIAINPLGLNAFISDTVFGATKTVYHFDGNA
jgi:hypothetical protein